MVPVIKTYISSQPGTSLYNLKGITIINARLENIAMVLRDVSNFPQWLEMCCDNKLVSKVEEDNMTMHIILKFPLIGFRDLVVRNDVSYNLEKARVLIALFNEKDSPVPVHKGAIRVREFAGSYQLDYLTPEKTGVKFSYTVDPDGFIPSFGANFICKIMLFETFRKLGDTAMKSQYKESREKSKDKQLIESIMSDNTMIRHILKARLMEYLNDEEAIDSMVADQNLVEEFIKDNGNLMEAFFMCDGSRVELNKTVSDIIIIHARQFTLDNKKIAQIAQEQALITTIIDGPKPRQPSAIDRFKGLAG